MPHPAVLADFSLYPAVNGAAPRRVGDTGLVAEPSRVTDPVAEYGRTLGGETRSKQPLANPCLSNTSQRGCETGAGTSGPAAWRGSQVFSVICSGEVPDSWSAGTLCAQ